MKHILKIFGVLLTVLIGFTALKTCDFGPPPRPDLDLPLAPQMADPGSARMDMNFPEVNPMAAKGVNPMPHGDSAQQDSTPIPGPIDNTRRLEEGEIVNTFMGPGHFGLYTSSPYANGKRVLWTKGVNGVFKLDEETYDIIDHLKSGVADKWNREWADKILAKLDKNNGASAIGTAVRSMMPLKSLSGVYAVVGANNWFCVANKDGSVVAYGDEVDGDARSRIIEKARFRLPAEIAGASVGMNMTYDGWIVFPMETGTLIAVSPDLTGYRSVRLKHADTEDTETRGVGYGWVRNSIAIDKDGGIYVASRNHMHKVVWTGDALSIDPADGAWTAQYRNSTGEGTGATPSLMGFGDEDRFLVFTDGDIRMNLVLMWRDDIPEGWQQPKGAPSRRIAGQAPVDMGDLDMQEIQSEQTVVVAGYGALVVNNTPRNTPFFLPKEGVGRGATIGPLGNNPEFQPYGVQKFGWNPDKQRLERAWVNETISSPNGVPWVSTGSGQVYFIGARNHEWTLEAVDWLTGEPTFHYIMGGQKYNNMFSGPTIDEKGRVFVASYFGRMRIQPDSEP